MKYFFGLIFLFFATQYHAQLKKYSFAQVEALQKIEERPVMVFVTADWCSYCQMTKIKTFENAEIIKNINEKFYFIELNQNEKETIHFMGKTYQYISNGYKTGSHELAQALTKNNVENLYPTTIVYDRKNQLLFKKQEFLKIEDVVILSKSLK